MNKIIVHRLVGYVLALLLATAIYPVCAQSGVHPDKTDPGFLAESDRFVFFSHMWLNMHHYLYNRALVYGSSGAENAIGSEIWQKLDEKQQNTTENVLRYYSQHIIDQDLRTGEYTYRFKRWVITCGYSNPLPAKEGFEEHTLLLNQFRDIYLFRFWNDHQAANKKVLDDNINMIRKTEKKFVERLSELCHARWQREKIRVDISYNSKRDIPYTTTKPVVHIVMDSRQSHTPKGNWFELLLHEASHPLIKSSSGFVSGTILDISANIGKKAPRMLWHAYLFYFSGKVARNLLAAEGISGYELYMVRTKMLFTHLFPLLDEHLAEYITGKITLAEATKRIIEDYR